MRKILSSVLAVLSIVLTVGVVSAAPASAAVSCSGTISYDGTVDGVGELTIYYNSTNGGTNSACFYHRGAAYGVAAPTYVRAFRCVESSGKGQPCTVDVSSSPDSGTYAYYAGPRGVTGTANRCVAAAGYIQWNGIIHYITTGRQGC